VRLTREQRAQVRALHAQGVAKREIAERLDLSRGTVAALLRRRATLAPRACRLCGEPFTPSNGRQRFCTPAHQREHERLHGPPSTTAGWRERVDALEAEIARVRAQLDQREAA
jgi:transposase